MKVIERVACSQDPEKIYEIEYTKELLDDLKAIHGDAAQDQLVSILQEEANERYRIEMGLVTDDEIPANIQILQDDEGNFAVQVTYKSGRIELKEVPK